jgi:hypothetical protein
VEATRGAPVGSPRSSRTGRPAGVGGARLVRVRLEWCVPNRAARKVRKLGHVRAERGRKEEKQTRMSSWSDRQSSMVTVSGWFGARTVE